MSEEVFNNEVYPGPTQRKFSIHVDDSRGIAFEATQGMTRKEFEDKNRRAVDDLFKEPEEIGSVFEKGQKLEEKAHNEKDSVKPTTNNGIDSNAVDALKRELSDKEIKGPSYEPSLNFVK